MKLTYLLCCLCLLFAISSSAQPPMVAPPQGKPILLTGTTLHVGNGEVIENAIIAFDKGVITAVGNQAMAQGFSGYETIDLAGKHIYPGFIAPNTNLGLVEINAVRSTNDFREVGTLNPNVRSIIAYRTDSEIIPTVRSNGVLLAQVAPQGGLVSGSSSIMQLDAWNWEDATVATDEGIHLNWPATQTYNWREGKYSPNKNYNDQIAGIKQFMAESSAYVQLSQVDEKNLKFEAMRGVYDRSANLYIHVNEGKAMMEAVLIAKEYDAKPVIVGGRDSWMITDFLKAQDVPVIVESTQRLPGSQDTDVDQPFKTPAMLQAAGVKFCFAHEGGWQLRNLIFQAGQAVGFGLDYEDAISGLSKNAAEIMGIGDRFGTLEKGKSATLIVTTGDVLDMRTATVEHAFIDGRKVDLNNKQKALYERFSKKFESQR